MGKLASVKYGCRKCKYPCFSGFRQLQKRRFCNRAPIVSDRLNPDPEYLLFFSFINRMRYFYIVSDANIYINYITFHIKK